MMMYVLGAKLFFDLVVTVAVAVSMLKSAVRESMSHFMKVCSDSLPLYLSVL